ncbi:MAG: UDP-galactopyranose mutase [Proteobacteria bacterium]|nr:UDP-galactopyranose mutase [Pseudomonadota bacterium]
MSLMRSTLVVGSGISGLSAAVFLAREGCRVELWEEKKESGGMLAPVLFKNIEYDRGSHRVHPESHPLLRELTASEGWIERSRKGLLVLGGRQIPYPPTPIGFLKGLGFSNSLAMACGFAVRPKRRRSFKSWEHDRGSIHHKDVGFKDFVISRVGHSAYNRFYKPYVEKVWGLDPSQISKTVAKQRISMSNPMQILKKALTPKKQTERVFLYPKNGLCALIKNLRNQAVELGVHIRSGRKFDVLKDTSSFDVVLYSGHLSALVPEVGLNHRGLYILHLAFPKGFIGEHDTWYVPESKYWFGRVSQPSRFSSHLKDDNVDILCVEIPEGRWGNRHQFLSSTDEIVSQLHQASILSSPVAPTDVKQTWLPKVYPLYHRDWLEKWNLAMRKVADFESIYPIGRQGLFLHCNMDHCVHISWEAAQQVLRKESVATWLKRCPEFLDLRVRD